jgi:hypothetical protein
LNQILQIEKKEAIPRWGKLRKEEEKDSRSQDPKKEKQIR